MIQPGLVNALCSWAASDYALTDAIISSGSANLSSATAGFSTLDLCLSIYGTGLAPGTFISALTDSTHIILSQPATGPVGALTIVLRPIASRVAQLTAERDAIIGKELNGGKDLQNLGSASANGKSMTFLNKLTAEDKLVLITAVLTKLRIIEGEPTASRANFQYLRR